ncbi:MAG: YcxB family protein [Bacteroidota bacterium]|nr:YcxB family protein [Chitinophagaceae bacterium]MDZ4808311.1 YcxB family protein [Bacteroidota bacterium]
MTIYFGYEKAQVMQALRYHFISRREIKVMLIMVNVFALASITLYALKKITPMAFLVGSFLWIVLMVSFWFILPMLVYRKAATFKNQFSMTFEDKDFTLSHERGSKSWPWTALKNYLETPHFFHLYFDSRSFFLVPKSGCKDIEEIQELRQIIKSKVKKG